MASILLTIIETDEVNALVVEAIPAAALRTRAKAFVIHRAVVGSDIVLAGNIKCFTDFDTLDELLRRLSNSTHWFG